MTTTQLLKRYGAIRYDVQRKVWQVYERGVWRDADMVPKSRISE